MSRSLLRLSARAPTAGSLASLSSARTAERWNRSQPARRPVAPTSYQPKALQARGLAQASTAPFPESVGHNPALAEGFKEVNEKLHEYGQYLTSCLPKFISQFSVYKDELTIYTSPEDLLHVLRFLKDHSQCLYKALMDVTAVDYPTRENRFEVVYNLLSHTHASRIRVKTYASELLAVPSAVPIFRGADWFEREVWDMFGVFFEGHPDLRRILTDYGFEGHPLRKDFPLTGYTEVRYSEEKKRVIYEPLQLTQAFRNFESSSPWEQVGSGVDHRPETFKIPEPKKEEEPPKK